MVTKLNLLLLLVIIGLGAGCIKANVSPLIGEQYQGKLRKETLPSGEVVIKSPAVTIQSIYMCTSYYSLASSSHFLTDILYPSSCRVLRCYQSRFPWRHLCLLFGP